MMSHMRTLITVSALVAVIALVAGCPKSGQAPVSGPPMGKLPPPAQAAGANTEVAGQPGAAQTTLKVLGPCGMIIPVDNVRDAFMKAHPDIKVDTVYDSSIVIARKIVDKAEPCDVFISPGTRQLEILRKAGKVDESTLKTITTFELVCIVPKGNPAGITKPEDLVKAKAISTPNEELDSVGYAGRQALQKLGLWDKVSKKIVPAESAILSHGFVAARKADAGIAFRNCPFETNPKKMSLSKVAIAFSFPKDSYDQVDGLVAMTNDCKVRDAAQAFIDFIASPEGLKILQAGGLDPVKPAAKPG
jgi:molybdate transport system substrate-binding protein